MAFSMEGRFPILNRLRDYVRALPSELKIDIDFVRNKNKNTSIYKRKHIKVYYLNTF